jgi:hypothetical protein
MRKSYKNDGREVHKTSNMLTWNSEEDDKAERIHTIKNNVRIFA